ncbi:PadR family transcriptional regulator [Microbacterium sp. NPDC056234]|uniref:PadR family transcriptional regulator n=1 Tax=Microbacterium sp. NPDC056234 TaxID=3345757 RepID=UPI0035DDD6DA
MQLKHAILGLLDVAPQSGYDLGRAFARSVAHFWHADQSQIYRTLDRLEMDGAISTEHIPQQGKPDRRVHSLTPAGRAELHEWLRGPLDAEQPKEPFLARVFFAASVGADTALELLDRREAATRAELDELRAFPRRAGDLAEVLRTATLDAGLRAGEAELDWIDATRRAIAGTER